MPRKEIQKKPLIDSELAAVPFTARLMAYYRARESKRDNPLFLDPFAERLADDLLPTLSGSKGDYPIVRSYYIDTKLLSSWCYDQAESQVVLLGAGLDTRAYRFKPLQTNRHTFFEIDFPIVIEYKEEVLKDEQPICKLVRLPADLSEDNWSTALMNHGFSQDLPSFWIMEGLVYYLDQGIVVSLLKAIYEMSTADSQIFTDICVPAFADLVYGPFTRYFKWGLDMQSVSSFFSRNGWSVSVSYADDHDQERDVGQRGLMFVHGRKSEFQVGPLDTVEVPTRLMPLEEIINGIERVANVYRLDQSVGRSVYLEFIRDARPAVARMAEGLSDVTSIGQISPRLLRDPLSFDIMAEDRTEEERESHIVGYLKAIVLLVYCVMNGLEGWQFRGTTLHKESLRIQNVSAITSLVELLRKDLGSKDSA